MIKRFYYNHDDREFVNREDSFSMGRRRLLKYRKEASMEVISATLNESIYQRASFLLGRDDKFTGEDSFRNDPFLKMDFVALRGIHNKLKSKGELKGDSNFYSWIHSLYEDPLSRYPWISKRGDINAKMPQLRPDVKVLLLNLRTLLRIRTSPLISNLKISIIPTAQNKLLVLTVMPPSTHFKFHQKSMENEYVDVLEEIFKNGKRQHRMTAKDSMWDFTGTNDDETISLKFEFKFVSVKDFTKKDKFDSISRKRLERTKKMIQSFRNFFSQHNKRHYDFSEEDFIAIDKSLDGSLAQFRNEYQRFFHGLNQKKIREKALERDLKRKNIHTERVVLEYEEKLKENMQKHQYELKKMNDKINHLTESLLEAIKEKK